MSLRRWQGPGASAGWLVAGLLLLLQLSGLVRASEITFELPDNAKQCFYEEIVQGTKCTLEFQVRRSPSLSRHHIGKWTPLHTQDNPPYAFGRFQLVGQEMGLEAAPLIVCVWPNRTEKAAGEEDCLETVAEYTAKTHLRIASATFRHAPLITLT